MLHCQSYYVIWKMLHADWLGWVQATNTEAIYDQEKVSTVHTERYIQLADRWHLQEIQAKLG